ncbi:MAG TPA: hypothetical protein PKA27_03870 [Fimbriimonadaceae bacterium]|nr:hypothetical protein [Fimbriimonadaceae bacterium]
MDDHERFERVEASRLLANTDPTSVRYVLLAVALAEQHFCSDDELFEFRSCLETQSKAPLSSPLHRFAKRASELVYEQAEPTSDEAHLMSLIQPLGD